MTIIQQIREMTHVERYYVNDEDSNDEDLLATNMLNNTTKNVSWIIGSCAKTPAFRDGIADQYWAKL